MSEKIEWGRLHDATLKTITVTWKDGTVQVDLITGFAPVVSIYVEGVMQLIVPHEAPWGPSVSVNDIRMIHSLGQGRQRLEIEMQSGDTILIEAIHFTMSIGK